MSTPNNITCTTPLLGRYLHFETIFNDIVSVPKEQVSNSNIDLERYTGIKIQGESLSVIVNSQFSLCKKNTSHLNVNHYREYILFV